MDRFLSDLGRVFPLFLLLVSSGGCASYYNHYAVFPAENSAGLARDVRVSWQTAEYPGWWFRDNRAGQVKVETQCSERVWQLTDEVRNGSCGEGIRACGDDRQDFLVGSRTVAGPGNTCMAINSGQAEQRVADLRGAFSLTVSCLPVSPRQKSGDKTIDMDYIRPSAVPYQVNVRKVARGTLQDRPPELDKSICDRD